MIKTILFTATLMTLALIGFATTSAYACGTCGCAEKHAQKSPCTKCAEAGKTCKCGKKAKKPCEKKMSAEKKPCKKCDESERAFQAKKRSEIFFNE